MKLIRNTKHKNIETYFPGIDYPNSWTLDNPAIYNYVKSTDLNNNDYINVPQFSYMSQEKYLLFKLQGGVHYNISYSNTHYPYPCFHLYLYDFLDYDILDIKENVNFIKYVYLGEKSYQPNIQSDFDIFFDYPTYILMKICPYDSDALNKSIKLFFSQQTLDFDYSTHIIIDWMHKVEANTWSYTGKVNSFNSLRDQHLINEEIKINDFDSNLVFNASLKEEEKIAQTGQKLYSSNIQYIQKQRRNSAYLDGNAFLYTQLDYEQQQKKILPVGQEARTLSAWVMPQYGCHGKFIVSIGTNFNNSIYGFGVSPQGVQVYGYNNTTSYNCVYYYNQWIHIVVVYQNGYECVYVNGNLIEQKRHQNLNTYKSNVVIGARSGDYSHQFVGYISDVRIYNKILTPEEIKVLYEDTK